jgi:hypothetical protein
MSVSVLRSTVLPWKTTNRAEEEFEKLLEGL